jgi:hypothetical protein
MERHVEAGNLTQMLKYAEALQELRELLEKRAIGTSFRGAMRGLSPGKGGAGGMGSLGSPLKSTAQPTATGMTNIKGGTSTAIQPMAIGTGQPSPSVNVGSFNLKPAMPNPVSFRAPVGGAGTAAPSSSLSSGKAKP